MGGATRDIKIPNETFIFEDLCHRQLQFGMWKRDRIVTHLYRVPDSGQHVCQWIGYRHFRSFSLSAWN
jgi:hypothetical protein